LRKRSAPKNSAFFQHGRRIVHIAAAEAHRGFEAQRVARAQAARDETGRLAGIEHGLPQSFGGRGRDKNLESVFARVARARHGRPDSRDLTRGKPVVLDGRQIDGRQRLQYRLALRPLQR
jgi:hypothetical protein